MVMFKGIQFYLLSNLLLFNTLAILMIQLYLKVKYFSFEHSFCALFSIFGGILTKTNIQNEN